MEKVKPGLKKKKKKLAHQLYGPFRIKRRLRNFAFELKLPGRSMYRFYHVVHVSRLKEVKDHGKRPRRRLVAGLAETDRFDFNEELLPEKIWEPDKASGINEVEQIVDDDLLLSSSIRRDRSFLVKLKGYDTLTWEPLTNLSCGGLL